MSNDWNRYGPTAARPPGAKPGRMVRPNSVTIDIHSHVAVPRASEFVKPHLDLATIPAEDPATYAMIRKADTVGGLISMEDWGGMVAQGDPLA